jgi:hypothetical protein
MVYLKKLTAKLAETAMFFIKKIYRWHSGKLTFFNKVIYWPIKIACLYQVKNLLTDKKWISR